MKPALKVVIIVAVLVGVFFAIKPLIDKRSKSTPPQELQVKDSIPVDSPWELAPRNVRHAPPIRQTVNPAPKKIVQKQQAPVKKQEMKSRKSKNGERENLEIEF